MLTHQKLIKQKSKTKIPSVRKKERESKNVKYKEAINTLQGRREKRKQPTIWERNGENLRRRDRSSARQKREQ